MYRVTAAAVMGLFLAGALTGCGGGEQVVRPTVSVSVGQQLIDLKKALDSGAISQRDYDSQRSKILSSP